MGVGFCREEHQKGGKHNDLDIGLYNVGIQESWTKIGMKSVFSRWELLAGKVEGWIGEAIAATKRLTLLWFKS